MPSPAPGRGEAAGAGAGHPETSDGVLRPPGEGIFAGIEERRLEYPLAVRCRVLGGSRSGYSAWSKRPARDPAKHRETRATPIREVYAERTGRDGSPRLTVEWSERGIPGGVNTVAKGRKAHGIRAKAAKRFIGTPDAKQRRPVAENVLQGDFASARPHAAWGLDIPSVPTLEGGLVLALGVELFSRRIVGGSMAAPMTSRLGVDAWEMAVPQRGAPVGLIAHSDRGSPDASDHDQSELRRRGLVCRMREVGPCWDNAVVESPFGSLKREWVHPETYATHAEAWASLFESIEVFDNRVRRHSTWGDVAPAEYEQTDNPKLR